MLQNICKLLFDRHSLETLFSHLWESHPSLHKTYSTRSSLSAQNHKSCFETKVTNRTDFTIIIIKRQTRHCKEKHYFSFTKVTEQRQQVSFSASSYTKKRSKDHILPFFAYTSAPCSYSPVRFLPQENCDRHATLTALHTTNPKQKSSQVRRAATWVSVHITTKRSHLFRKHLKKPQATSLVSQGGGLHSNHLTQLLGSKKGSPGLAVTHLALQSLLLHTTVQWTDEGLPQRPRQRPICKNSTYYLKTGIERRRKTSLSFFSSLLSCVW